MRAISEHRPQCHYSTSANCGCIDQSVALVLLGPEAAAAEQAACCTSAFQVEVLAAHHLPKKGGVLSTVDPQVRGGGRYQGGRVCDVNVGFGRKGGGVLVCVTVEGGESMAE